MFQAIGEVSVPPCRRTPFLLEHFVDFTNVQHALWHLRVGKVDYGDLVRKVDHRFVRYLGNE